MNVTITIAESDSREFARRFPTPNALRAISLAEAGRITWFQVYDLFRVALVKGFLNGSPEELWPHGHSSVRA